MVDWLRRSLDNAGSTRADSAFHQSLTGPAGVTCSASSREPMLGGPSNDTPAYWRPGAPRRWALFLAGARGAIATLYEVEEYLLSERR